MVIRLKTGAEQPLGAGYATGPLFGQRLRPPDQQSAWSRHEKTAWDGLFPVAAGTAIASYGHFNVQ